MNPHNFDHKKILDLATQSMRENEPLPAETQAAADRVWSRLETISPPQTHSEPEVIRDCDGFRGMIPAYRQGILPPARLELFQDHIRSCVHCRRALWKSSNDRPSPVRPEITPRTSWRGWALGAAALLVLAVGLKYGIINPLLFPAGETQAVAERIDGSLFRLQEGRYVPVTAQETLPPSELIRTGRGARAILRLPDGSRVEMNEHSELAIEPRRSGLAVSLRRGGVIIEAAKQRTDRHLFVEAPDCEVAVKGTVFAVSSGPKGSRVSVLEGEVWVTQGNTVTKLAPGGQATTQATISPVPVAQEVAWSSDPERYRAFLDELAETSQQMMRKLADIPLRFDSPLLSRLPSETFLFVAAPNIAREIGDAGLDLERRLRSNPQLQAWFDKYRQENPAAPDMVEVLERFRELGSFAGNEVVLAVTGPLENNRPSFLLLTQARDEEQFRQAIRGNLQRMNSLAGQPIPVVLVDNPAAIPAQPNPVLYVYVGGGLAVATDRAAEIVSLATSSPVSPSGPVSSPFFSQIARCYQDGVTWLVAADVEKITAMGAAASHDEKTELISEDLGLRDMQVFLLEHKRIASQDQLRSVLAFSRDRRGIPAWLGSPAPMGALEFVSPNALAAGCFLSKEPKAIADEVLAVMKKHNPEGFGKLLDFEKEHQFSLRDDLAAPLGGEFLFAIDGPILPKPAWKLVVLMEDQARLQQAIENMVAQANTQLSVQGKPTLSLGSTAENEGTFYTLTAADGLIELHYTFWDGYWVIAPQKILLKEALQTRRSGLSLPTTTVFRQSLPADGQQLYSGLGYANFGWLASAAASAIPGNGTNQHSEALMELQKLVAQSPAMTFCVTAERDRILFTSTSLDILTPSRVLSLLSEIKPLLPQETTVAEEPMNNPR